MRTIVSVAMLYTVAAGTGACDRVDEPGDNGQPGAITAGDGDGGSDAIAECDAGETLDYGSPAGCTGNSGWPCMCQNSWTCDDGTACQGHQGLSNGWLGQCAPRCGVEECPTTGLFGLGVAKICNTYLTPDGCMCLLSGCNDTDNPCQWGGMCVEPSCIPSGPGCEEGEGEVKVCYPNNW